ncbi:transposon Ty3-G Gag-Pol polyprotein [Trichonephila inaurata madagascariensis]|uniref:Transposon Ty3-G Gag-Pol polyprotein n=1 Tax=Trichonephila inaurata madagascariensis TaxID=2747483 RepID=A0A8X7BUC0_9ARAC|nr:transposon Ty3-G Gag-Pol polyprotein [Trichonephila inaurata madagascariensis]
MTYATLNTYHIDHLGPLATSHKNYKFILAVIDSFTTNLFWFIPPLKTTSTSEVIKKDWAYPKLHLGILVFLSLIIGTTFTSTNSTLIVRTKYFTSSYYYRFATCKCGQVERINRTIISVLSKMSEDDPTKWFKHVPSLQVLNSTFQRSINTTARLLFWNTNPITD